MVTVSTLRVGYRCGLSGLEKMVGCPSFQHTLVNGTGKSGPKEAGDLLAAEIILGTCDGPLRMTNIMKPAGVN